MCSQFTAYTDVFRFEAAVNLCRNACSRTFTYDLRACFHQPSRRHTLPLYFSHVHYLSLFRSKVLLSIYRVMQGHPGDLSTCAVCARAHGSLRFIHFDGIGICFKLRCGSAFERIALKLKPIHSASIMAQTF